MRAYHKEIDELRRSGAFKEALDLARYAHGERREHRLIKRSYAWALYAYLKIKIQRALSDPADVSHLTSYRLASTTGGRDAPLINEHPRRREINLLCREYRVAKLAVSDLCLSLILGQLCRLSPPPLGLFGLTRWAQSSALRPEDLISPSEHPQLPPLARRVTRGLTQMISYLDQERALREPDFKLPLDSSEIAELTLNLIHQQRTEDLSHDLTHERASRWALCELNRRAAYFDESLRWGVSLLGDTIRPHQDDAELWWELAQTLAAESETPSALTFGGVAVARSLLTQGWPVYTPERREQLSQARALALRATHCARAQGVYEVALAEVYARIGFWSAILGETDSAQAFLWWAVEVSRRYRQPSPYSWSAMLNTYDAPSVEPWDTLRVTFTSALDDSARWLDHVIESFGRDHSGRVSK